MALRLPETPETLTRLRRLRDLLRTEDDRRRAEAAAKAPALWTPQPGPQTQALQSPAFIVGYGGQAGGGKTDWLAGTAITNHRRSIIFRREAEQLEGSGGIVARAREILGTNAAWSGRTARFGHDQALEFGGMKDADSWQAYMGKPHDFIGFDEASHFLESQVRALMGWARTAFPNQRVRIGMGFNPPTAPEQEWIIRFFAPWLDKNHPNPAKDGELRYFAMVDGAEIECPSGAPFEHKNAAGRVETIQPLSRTFFRARLEDNAYYMATNYEATLAALPEPLRSLLRWGAFDVAQEDDPWQVIPTAWVVAAQERWKRTPRPEGVMDALGVDVARGGQDKTVYTARFANYFETQIVKPGRATKDGQAVVRDILEIKGVTPATPVQIDVVGVGSSPTDIGNMFELNIVPMNGAQGSSYVAGRGDDPTQQGTLRMSNKRAEWWWKLREKLDPTSGEDLAIPPDPELRADLCAARWKLMARGVQIWPKDAPEGGGPSIKKLIGRSPDKGESLVYASADDGMNVGFAVPIVVSRPRGFPGT